MLLAGRGFDGLAAAGVELEQVIDLVFGLGGGGQTEAGGRGRWAADVGVAGHKLKQVEGDVFGTAGYGERRGFHASDGIGWRVRVQTAGHSGGRTFPCRRCADPEPMRYVGGGGRGAWRCWQCRQFAGCAVGRRVS